MLWTDEEVKLISTLRPYCTTREIEQVFHLLGLPRSMEGIAKKARSMGLAFEDLGDPPLSHLKEKQQRIISQILSERDSLIEECSPPVIQTASQKSKITTATRATVQDIFQELQRIRKLTPRTEYSLRQHGFVSSKRSLIVNLSDWHMGKVIRDEHGHEIYNMKIAQDRILQTPAIVEAKVLPFAGEIDEIVLAFEGDHADGEAVYIGQHDNIEAAVCKQLHALTQTAWEMIQYFRQLVPNIHMITVRGNHGRIDKHSIESNFDNFFYQQLELLVDSVKDPGITIKNRYAIFNSTMVKGWKFHIRHEAPVQGETRAGKSRYADWEFIHNYDLFAYGHWHHWGVFTYNGVPIVRNGSLCGGDDYSENFGSHDEPNQMVVVVSPSRNPVCMIPLEYK